MLYKTRVCIYTHNVIVIHYLMNYITRVIDSCIRERCLLLYNGYFHLLFQQLEPFAFESLLVCSLQVE